MKKKSKLITSGLSLVLGALMLSGCTKSFCTVDDQAHMMYMFDYGVTEYYDSNVEGSTQLFEGNDQIFVRYTQLDKMSELSGIGIANKAAATSGAPTPSIEYWKAVDTVVLDKALSKSGFDKSTVTYTQLFTSLNDYGYLKFAGTGDDNSLFAYFNTIIRDASQLVSYDECPTEDYITVYKNGLLSTIQNYRSCFAIDNSAYGYYGYESGTGFREVPGRAGMTKKTWGSAWGQGLFQGLLVYPIAWLTETFVGLFTNETLTLDTGVPQILALLVVTIIVRGLMLLLTFRSTAANSKMQLIQPEMARIQAKYPNSNTNRNEQQRMAMEMQALYKKHGINPLSSLLVLIIQFPVFICVWGALQASASLSTGSFLGLNLSASISSTLFTGASWKNGSAFTALVLFLLMAGAQIMAMLLPRILQKKKLKNIAKLGKNPAQKEQDSKTRIFMIVMLAMTIIMGFTLVSAMGVYWLVGALFTIAQTLITNAISNRKKAKK